MCAKIKTCPICCINTPSDEYISTLGTTPICFECHMNLAEAPDQIWRSTQAVGKDGLAGLRIALENATCFAGQDEGYLPLAEWERRKTERQLALVKFEEPGINPDDEDNHLRHIMAKIAFATRHFTDLDEMEAKRPTRPTRLGQWLKGLFQWHRTAAT